MSSWRLYAVHFVAVLGFASGTLFGQSAGSIPQGWYVYPNSELMHAEITTFRCFNWSHNEWEVSAEGDDVRIAKRIRGKADVPSLPPLLKVQPGMPGRTPSAGLVGAMQFARGWLLAYDGDGLGGGLWLTNQDGSKTKRILSKSVRAIVRLDDSGVLVLAGYVNMIPDDGYAYVFSNPDGLRIRLQHSDRLYGAPMAFTKRPDGSVLFITTHSLHEITESGPPKLDHRFPLWVATQYPNSVVTRPDGTIFIGMRMFALRLTPNLAGYVEDWLLPNSCRKFELNEKEVDCVCKSW